MRPRDERDESGEYVCVWLNSLTTVGLACLGVEFYLEFVEVRSNPTVQRKTIEIRTSHGEGSLFSACHLTM